MLLGQRKNRVLWKAAGRMINNECGPSSKMRLVIDRLDDLSLALLGLQWSRPQYIQCALTRFPRQQEELEAVEVYTEFEIWW